MRRYRGEAMAPGSRIAVIANDAIGNFVVSTPLLQMLRRKLRPSTIHYYGGTRTAELQQASELFEWSYNLHGTSPRVASRDIADEYDLIVNQEGTAYAKTVAAFLAGESTYVVGPCVGEGGRGDLAWGDDEQGRLAGDKEWIAADLTKRYPILQTGFIGEIFCRLAYLEGPIPPYAVPTSDPSRPIPDVLIATAASLSDKLWPVEKWIEIAKRLKAEGLTVGLLGAKPSAQKEFWKGDSGEERLVGEGWVEDLRGLFTLPEVQGALCRTNAVFTLDNGILHMAAASGRPTVGLFRNGIHRLWAPRVENLTVLIPEENEPVAAIEVDAAWEALKRAL